MAAVSWKSNVSGDWDTASNWSTGVLPGPNDDVTISTSSPQTITHSTSVDTVHSLFVGNDTLTVSGGSLTVLGNTTLDSALNESGGLFVLSGASALIDGTVSQTAGSIDVASGTLTLRGTGNNFAGTLSGATAEFAAGTDLLAAGLALNMGQVLIDGGVVTLGENITQSGLWTQTAGTLALGGNTLTAGGVTSLDGGVISGSGTVAITNTGEISGLYLENSVVLDNIGDITQTGDLHIGYNGTDTPQLINESGATYTITNNSEIYGTAGASLTNAGTLDKLASGNSEIYASATNTGQINIASGTLSLDGSTDSLGGTIAGAGTLALVGGADALASELSLSVAHVQLSGGVTSLGANVTYAHDWSQSGGTLALGGHTFTQSGTVNLAGGIINGAGMLVIPKSGNATISGGYVEGTATIRNVGRITQSGNWYLGYNGTDTPTLNNLPGSIFTLANGADLHGTTGASLTNAGQLIKIGGGTSAIDVSTSSTFIVRVSSGVLAFQGGTNSFSHTISGPGELNLVSGSDILNTSNLIVGSVLLSGANVSLGTGITYKHVLTQTAGTLALGGNTFTLSGTTNLDGGVVNGAGTLDLTRSAVIDNAFLEGSVVLNNTGAVTQSGYVYVGYNGTDTVTVNNQATGKYTITGNSTVYGTAGSSLTNAGTLIKQDGGVSQVNVAVTSTGSINVASGTLRFVGGTNNFSGTISGSGTLDLGGGIDSFGTALALDVANVLLGGANLSLAADLAYAGDWTQTTGTLAVGGHTLVAAGTINLDGGVINGAGTVDVTKSGSVSGAYLEGSVVLYNSASITETGFMYVGYNGTDTAKLDNAAGGTFILANDSEIYGSAGGSIINAGTFIKHGGGVSQINAAASSTGTITVGSGVLEFSGSANSFAGTVGGAGQLVLNTGADSFISGLHLNVASVLLDGANVSLGGNLNYVGNLAMTAGTLALGGNTLTTSGTDNLNGGVINGSGTLAIGGSADLATTFLEGSAVLSNTGNVVQTNYIYIGYNASDTAKLVNQTGATFGIANNSEIHGSAGSSLVNNGTLEKSLGAGLSQIDVATINSGVVDVGSGTMRFINTVSGTGTFNVGANTTLQFAAAVAAGSTVNLGTDADLFVQASAGFAGSIADFAPGNLIEMSGLGYNGTSLSFNAGTDRLTVSNGAFNTTLQFIGSYTSADFRLLSDSGTAAIAHT